MADVATAAGSGEDMDDWGLTQQLLCLDDPKTILEGAIREARTSGHTCRALLRRPLSVWVKARQASLL
jgi:hypothetical protein